MSEVPAAWSSQELGELAEFIMGQAPPGSQCNKSGIGTPFVKAGEFGEERPTIREWTTRPLKLASANDVLICVVGATAGKINLGADCAIGRSVAAIRPSRALDQHFLHKFLSTIILDMRAGSAGSAQGVISKGDLENVKLPLPPLPEQRRIVAKIDSLSTKSRRARDQLDHLPRLVEKYKQAILAAAFQGDLTGDWRRDHHHSVSTEQLETLRRAAWQSLRDRERVKEHYSPADSIDWQPPIHLPSNWIWASVDQIASLIQYGTSAKTTEDKQGIAVLRMGNIQDGKLDLSSLKFLPKDHNEFPDLLLERGDVLFNRTNSAQLVGKSALYLGEPEKASYASYLIRIRCSGLLPELLSGYINSSCGREWVASVVSQQVGQANVNGTKLRQLGIPVMPHDEQHEIVRCIETAFAWIYRLATEATRARKLIDHLDQAVLSKAFRGELVPQDPNDELASILLERIRSARSSGSADVRRKKPKR